MGAEYLFYMKSIETHARAFLALIILGIGTVLRDWTMHFKTKKSPLFLYEYEKANSRYIVVHIVCAIFWPTSHGLILDLFTSIEVRGAEIW